MNILHIFPHPLEKGVDVLSQSVPGLVVGQANQGINVGLLSTFPTKRDAELIDIDGVMIVPGPEKKHCNPISLSKMWLDHIYSYFGRPDIVHFHFAYNCFQTSLARLLIKEGIPYISTPRGSLTYIAQRIKWYKKVVANKIYYNSFIKNADAIHALNHSELVQAKELFQTKNVIEIPNGIEDEVINSFESLMPEDLSHFRKEGKILLGFVGRVYVFHKGLDLLLNSLGMIKRNSEKFPFQLFIVGPYKTNKDKKAMDKLLKDNNLIDDVLMVGPKYDEDKLRYFLACDVFVHTSRFEGMPMSLLEAMATGRPAMASEGTNIAEVVRKAGGWICGETSEQICNTLMQVVQDASKIKEKGLMAHNLIKNEYTWNNIAEIMIEQLYKPILNK